MLTITLESEPELGIKLFGPDNYFRPFLKMILIFFTSWKNKNVPQISNNDRILGLKAKFYISDSIYQEVNAPCLAP
jgi:hypothetical protein